MKTPGDEITSLLYGAKRNALIVAPFIRSEALSRLLESIPDGTKTTVVTRWRPADLLSGASDLSVYDLTESKKIALYLRQDLHAKFFAADDMCLIGSVNVTLTALGWRMPSNFELLTPVARTDDRIIEFEKTLLSGSVPATSEQRDRLERLIERLDQLPNVTSGVDTETTTGLLLPNWVPQTRNPEELYLVYCGNLDVSRSALKTMQEELKQIGTVPGMNEEEFKEWIAATISQTPLVSRVVQCINEDGQVSEDTLGHLLSEIGVDGRVFSPRDVLEILERWLTYFLPIKFQTVQDSIKLIKAKRL